MSTRDRVWVKTWRVTVNNSGQSNMTNVVGRYMTRKAAERVAQAFRDALYADPYNYATRCDVDREQKTVEVTTFAAVDVRVEEDGFNHMMAEEAIRLAQQNGVYVCDENGTPIVAVGA